MSDTTIPAICGCLYVTFIFSMIMAIGSLATQYFFSYDSFAQSGGDLLSGVHEMGRDWQQSPFIELYLEKEKSYCDAGWEPTYERPFYGMAIGCDCAATYYGGFDRGAACTRNQTRDGCNTSRPHHPVIMHNLEVGMICGKPSGIPFLTA